MRIFISYAHDDTQTMLEVKQALDVHEVWFDHRLSVGQEWWNEIEHNIAACDCFVLLLSQKSLDSEYCQKELETALKLDKPIAPIMIAAMPIPEKLSRFQIISLVGGNTSES